MSILKRMRGRQATEKHASAEYQTISYSQEGEDLVLSRLFPNRTKGFYVDIGAHHPYRFSNTYFFYKMGWTGINIDPIPGIKKLFDAERPGDINLEMAVSDENSILNYYNFKEKALNTFSESLAKQYQAGNWELESVIPIETFTVAEILDRHCPPGKKIDFMSIDVENLEMKVLGSNNWERYSPEVLVIEILDCPAENVMNTEVFRFLSGKGYLFFAKTFNTCFFKLKN